MPPSLGPSLRKVAAGLSLFMLATPCLAIPPAPPAPSVDRTVPAVSYGGGAITKADLKGTDLAPKAKGSVKIAVKQGTVSISLSAKGLPPAMSFGPEYMTYVAWGVTPDGRLRNIGEVVAPKGSGAVNATTQAQSFGLIVTAEPYFAVANPSEVVVLENVFEGKAAEKAAPTPAKYKAFARKTYGSSGLETPDPKSKVPPDLYQARNAVRIAKEFGAESYAGEPFGRASRSLAQAEGYLTDKKSQKLIAPKAREATQAAESARLLAVKNGEEARVAAEKAESAAKAADANAKALAAQTEAAAAQARATDAQAMAAEESRRRAAAEKTAANAEAEKQALRAKLVAQFGQLLQTQDTARGIILNMGDVLFDVDKYTLKPEAREMLAKLSGIVLGNPGLKLAVEGHTDSSGSEEYNQKLSENRAGAVRDYLVGQKVANDVVSARGFGKAQPVAPNDTAEGRKKNRRVEIVVSGDIIGAMAEY